MIDMDELPGLTTLDGDQMSLKSVKANGLVKGLLLEMTVRQHYQNDTNKNLETVYTFPLSWGATFMDLTVEMGGKRLSGVVTEKKEAIRRYEKAISEGDAPIMLEKNSEGLYTVNLGNLKAGEEAVIEYTYSQLLKYEEGTVRLTLPTTIAPRYGSSEHGGIQKHQTTENNLLVEYPFTLSISLTGGIEVATVECPSHQVQVSNKEGHLIIEIVRGAYLDRDFILNLSKLDNKSFCIVTPDKNIGPEGCTVLASFCPPIPTIHSTKPINLKILVDCSGSMEGDSIESAKRALHHVLSHLESKDRFSYSCYGTTVKHSFKEMKIANTFNTIAANLLIGRTKADMGGTETGDALISTFNLGDGEYQSDVLLITDGEIWETEEVIQEAKDSGNRVFAIGVGSAPAESFLQELAEKTGGACELVAPNENIEQAIVRMFNRIRLPRINDVHIDWGSNEEPLWVSGNTQAIFHGNTTHLFAGFDHLIRTTPTLSLSIEDQLEKGSVSSNQLIQSVDFNIARLGASMRLKTLTRGKDKTELAVRYQLVTENTNYILVHLRSEEEKSQDLPELQKIAQMQTAGWGGASSVNEEQAEMSIKISCMRSVSYSQGPVMYEMQDLQQNSSANISDLRAFKSTNDRDFYDIPAFLRVDRSSSSDDTGKSYSEKIMDMLNTKKNKPKQLTPTEVIDIANFEIEKTDDISEFVKVMSTQKLPQELLGIIRALSKKLGIDGAWITILAWLVLCLEDDVKWNTETKRSIEKLTESLDSMYLSSSLQILNKTLFNLTKNEWI